MTPQGTFKFYVSTNLRNTIGDFNTVPHSDIDNYLDLATGRCVGTRSSQMYTRISEGRGRVRVDISSLQGQTAISAEKIECADYLTITEGAGYWDGSNAFKRYCFIDRVSYVNDSVYDIDFTEDVYHTWYSRLTFGKSFVERETTPTDPLFDAQTEIPDVVESASYNVDLRQTIEYSGSYLCVVTTKILDAKGHYTYGSGLNFRCYYNGSWVDTHPEADVYDAFDVCSNLAQGLYYYIFPSPYKYLKEFIANAPQNVVLGVFNIPKAIVNNSALPFNTGGGDVSLEYYLENYSGSNSFFGACICPSGSFGVFNNESGEATGGAQVAWTNEAGTDVYVCFKYKQATAEEVYHSTIISDANLANAFEGYGASVKNKKLFSYPYCVVNISNNVGDNINLNPEKLPRAPYPPDELSQTKKIELTVHGILSLPPITTICPKYEGLEDNPTKRIMAATPPSVPYNQDALAQWFQQNKISLAIGAGKTILGVGVSIATANPVFALAGASSLASMSAKEAAQAQAKADKAAEQIGGQIGGALNQGVGLAQQAATISQMTQSTSGAGQGDVIARGEGCDSFTVSLQSIPYHVAEKLDNFFTYYGYAIGKSKDIQSQWTSSGTKRTKFYYVKTRGLNVKSAIASPVPTYAKERIREIFDNGFRCWSASNFLDYDNTNAIVTPT